MKKSKCDKAAKAQSSQYIYHEDRRIVFQFGWRKGAEALLRYAERDKGKQGAWPKEVDVISMDLVREWVKGEK